MCFSPKTQTTTNVEKRNKDTGSNVAERRNPAFRHVPRKVSRVLPPHLAQDKRAKEIERPALDPKADYTTKY
jgi:hypothetical protein